MKRRILIEKSKNKIRTYLIEDDDIVEIHTSINEEQVPPGKLGDIYIGKVQNIVQNIGAAFIEITKGVNCYFDLKDAENAYFTHKSGKKPLCIGDELVVQISREAVKTKAPTVTSHLSFTGRYAVLTHGNTRIGVSSKIPRALRDEFKDRLSRMKNEQFGIIIRTNAKGVPFQEVEDEIERLKEEYKKLLNTALSRVAFSRLKSAPPTYISDLKNVYMEGMEEIVIEGKDLYTEIQEYFLTEFPEKVKLLRLYENPDFPLCKLYSTETALEKALKEFVWLKNGGYLIIQPTEALTVIDVNSGKMAVKSKNSAGAMKVNMEAAQEAAKQIRLRNLSGIIIVDFVNLESKEDTGILLKEFRNFLSKDPIPTTLVDMTMLGLVEITRKKVRKPLYEQENYLQAEIEAL